MAGNFDTARYLDQYRLMWRIRAFEEEAVAAARRGDVSGAVHASIGQEAIAAGVCTALERNDQITTTHRGHGHCIAKGASPAAMMCELFGKAGGTSGGKGGSMHIADFSVGMLGANGVVAAGLPIAVGAAHGARLLGENRLVACFFGDGAINRGPFLEALNWAALFSLPVLFVAECNGYASTTRSDAVTAGPGPGARAEALGVPAHRVDGNDIVAVSEQAAGLADRLRAGAGPQFLEAHTYRLEGHTAADAGPYRDPQEVAARWRDDPIRRTRELLESHGVASDILAAAEASAREEMAAAVTEARAAPPPPPEAAFSDVQDVGGPSWGR